MQIEILEPAGDAYRPGVCNIGPREVAKRRAFGVVGIAVAVALGALLLVVDAPPLARILVLLPLWGGLISLEQARRKFCAGFARAGIRTAFGSDATEAVTDAADLATDRAAGQRMVAYCGAIAAAVTAVFVLLPI